VRLSLGIFDQRADDGAAKTCYKSASVIELEMYIDLMTPCHRQQSSGARR
jgi:hypothetical protein